MEPRRARGLASVRLSPPVTPEGPLPSGTADTSALFPFTCQMPGCFFSHRAFLIFFFLIILSCPTGFSHCLHLDLWTLETLLWGDCQAPVMRLCLEQLPSNLRGAAAPGRGGPQLSSVSFQEGGHTSFYFQAVTQSLVIYLSKSPTCIFGPWDPGVFPPSGLHRCWTQSPMPVVSASLPTLGFHSVSRPHRCSSCF